MNGAGDLSTAGNVLVRTMCVWFDVVEAKRQTFKDERREGKQGGRMRNTGMNLTVPTTHSYSDYCMPVYALMPSEHGAKHPLGSDRGFEFLPDVFW